MPRTGRRKFYTDLDTFRRCFHTESPERFPLPGGDAGAADHDALVVRVPVPGRGGERCGAEPPYRRPLGDGRHVVIPMRGSPEEKEHHSATTCE
jgi:hypothetical protein